MVANTDLPPPAPGTGPGISMKDMNDQIQQLAKTVEELKKRVDKLEKK